MPRSTKEMSLEAKKQKSDREKELEESGKEFCWICTKEITKLNFWMHKHE